MSVHFLCQVQIIKIHLTNYKKTLCGSAEISQTYSGPNIWIGEKIFFFFFVVVRCDRLTSNTCNYITVLFCPKADTFRLSDENTWRGSTPACCRDAKIITGAWRMRSLRNEAFFSFWKAGAYEPWFYMRCTVLTHALFISVAQSRGYLI